ncbi:MAG: radical SAM protein [Candidatus Omnitrophica bacterium]|nr:radical SAM protein [Candidatus Omnitrophota bacterium]
MFGFIGAIIASNFKRLSSPFKLGYAVTYRCNLKCKMCNIWHKDDHSRELSVFDIEKFFLKPHGLHWVGLTGGECFLRADLPEIADVIISNSKQLSAMHIATNGTRTDKIDHFMTEVRKKHRKIKFVFTVSIDGPSDIHNKIRGVEGVWEKALTTFKMLKKMPLVKPQFGFTLSHSNVGQFEDTFHSLKDVYPQLRFDDISVYIFQKSSFYYDNQDMLDLDKNVRIKEINKILALDKEGCTLNNFLRRKFLQMYLTYLQTSQTPIKCQSAASTCYLDPYGTLYPCSVWNRKLFNIKETNLSLKEIWQTNEANNIYKDVLSNKCTGCWTPCDAYSAMGGSLLQTILWSGSGLKRKV